MSFTLRRTVALVLALLTFAALRGQSNYATPYTFTTVAGSAGNLGSTDGSGSAARFFRPEALTVDSSGNVYVADTINSTIRKITSNGVVTTLAGSPTGQGSADGAGSAARFLYPGGIAVDSSGNLYVADNGNSTIRKVTSAGVVTTLAGVARPDGGAAAADGTGSAARFYGPAGIAVDGEGNLFVADVLNHTIRKITSGGVVSTLAGLAGVSGSADGTGAVARFNFPYGIAVDPTGIVYVADFGNDTIRRITSGGVVTTLAGKAGSAGSTDGLGSAARFNSPHGLAVDSAGSVYVADRDNSTIRMITSGGVVSTMAGLTGSFGKTDGAGNIARFNSPVGVAADSAGKIYVVDKLNHTIRVGMVAETVNPPRLINLSILTSIATAGDGFTMGYVVGGAGTNGGKSLLVRAAGPSLAALGVPGSLDDPKIELFAGTTKSGENDNWGGGATLANAMASVGAFAYAGTTSRDAATAFPVSAGDNSIKVSAVGAGTGTVIAEIYDATPPASYTATTPRLVNVSVLKHLGTGVTIGFVVGGSGTKNVLVRAIGPTIGAAPFNVPGVVADPQLTLYSGQAVVGSNDNWGGTTALSTAFTQVGAFALPDGSRDAALAVSLAPGNYTVQVGGVSGTTGLALVEIYELPASANTIALNTGSVSPGETLQILGSGFDPTLETTITFTDSTGMALPIPAQAITATKIDVTTPFFVDPKTGLSSARSVTVSVTQKRGSTTVPLGTVFNVQVGDLPASSAVPGTITAAYLRAVNAVLVGAQATWARLEGSTAAGTLNASSAKAAQQSLDFEKAIQQVMSGTSPSVFTGAVDGTNFILNKDALLMLDRLILAYGVPGQPLSFRGARIQTIDGRQVARDGDDHQRDIQAAIQEVSDDSDRIRKIGEAIFAAGLIGIGTRIPALQIPGVVAALGGLAVIGAAGEIAIYLDYAANAILKNDFSVAKTNWSTRFSDAKTRISKLNIPGLKVGEFLQTLLAIEKQTDITDPNSVLDRIRKEQLKPTIFVSVGEYRRPYGVPNPDFVASAVDESGRAVSLGTLAAVTWNTTATPTSSVDHYAITVFVQPLSDKYFFVVDPGDLEITPVRLTVTANSKTMLVGSAVPTLDVKYDGWRNDDGVGLLNGRPEITSTATSASPLGNYAINVAQGTLLSLDNYTFEFRSGTLSVVADIDRTKEFEAACLGTWTVTNGTSTYRLVLAAGGSGTYFTADNTGYRTTWRIARSGAEYRLYESGFWHPGYSQYTPEPLTMPVGTFRTILKQSFGDIPLGSVGITYSR